MNKKMLSMISLVLFFSLFLSMGYSDEYASDTWIIIVEKKAGGGPVGPPPTVLVCVEMWLDEYQCDGNWRQRRYQYSDCSLEWRDYEYCDYGCSMGECLALPILFEISPKIFDLVGCPNAEFPIQLSVYNGETDDITISLSFEGDTEIVSSEFEPTTIGPKENITIEMTIHCPSVILDKKAVGVVKAKMGFVEAERKFPIYLGIVELESQELGSPCWASECCESGYCSPEGICEPLVIPPTIPVEYIILGVLALIGLFYLTMRK